MADKPTPQQEDYLEAIGLLLESEGRARVGAIAARVSVHKSTVTAALHGLSDRGWVHYSPYEAVTLTPEGRLLAERVRRRHRIIERFLREVLLLPPVQAARNACRLEHAVDGEVTARLVDFMHFLGESEPDLAALAERFERYRPAAPYPDDACPAAHPEPQG